MSRATTSLYVPILRLHRPPTTRLKPFMNEPDGSGVTESGRGPSRPSRSHRSCLRSSPDYNLVEYFKKNDDPSNVEYR